MKYLLGIDGGGTGTKITVAAPDGTVLAQMSAGALNGNGQSADRLRETAAQIVRALDARGYVPGDCEGIGAGVAGISNEASGDALKDIFVENGFGCTVRLYGDHETALAAAFPSGSGIILIAGTGSICYGRRKDGTGLRVGGFGHLIDDCGSAYAVGRDILSAIVREEDGRGEHTVLRKLVFDKLQIGTVRELIGYVYHPDRSKKEIAGLAVLLTPAAVQGDRLALAIEEKCTGELAELVLTALRRFNGEKNLAFGGSVLMKNERIRIRLCQKLWEQDPEIRIEVSEQDASLGALRLFIREWAREGGNRV